MENIIEVQRRLHEEIEQLESCLVDLLSEASAPDKIASSHKDRVTYEYKCKYYIDTIEKKSNELYNLYQDEEGFRKLEISSLSAPNEFQHFYHKYNDLQGYFKDSVNLIEPPIVYVLQENDERIQKYLNNFTDEEGFGKYLDLTAPHNLFINMVNKLKLTQKNDKEGEEKDIGIDYLTYLTDFDQFTFVPRAKKNTTVYKGYLEALDLYLKEYYIRSHPLEDIEEHLSKAIVDFTERWENNSIQEWEKQEQSSLYCKACAKMFAKETVYNAHLNGKKHKKNLNKLNNNNKNSSSSSSSSSSNNNDNGNRGSGDGNNNKEMYLAKLEFEIHFLAFLLNDQRIATKTNVERKMARTASEWQKEDSDEWSADDFDDSEEENASIYNPKNLPLDWDGKRIPYWLYKLHGLSKYYACEICDGSQYRGPKAFAKHFQEAKHSQGMRLLGIPNTKHFQGVTEKEGAKQLWAKIKNEKTDKLFRPDMEEEYEDSLGNVVSKRIYQDLKNNNLL